MYFFAKKIVKLQYVVDYYSEELSFFFKSWKRCVKFFFVQFGQIFRENTTSQNFKSLTFVKLEE